MTIITSGYKYLDIDALGGIIAYTELLKLLNEKAIAVSTAQNTVSITNTILSWNIPLRTIYTPNGKDKFILIDISDPKYFESFVTLDKVIKIIDHHAGFEKYWTEKLGNNAEIEFIGAACTLVYENWIKLNLIDKISPLSASLLVSGILDNTLNFGAKITTVRDKAAYDNLITRSGLGHNWPKQYFKECQQAVFNDVGKAIKNDTKTFTLNGIINELHVAQLAVWDGSELIDKFMENLISSIDSRSSYWFINVIDICNSCSYFICRNEEVKNKLTSLLKINFDKDVARAERLWLRKEIIKADIS